MRAKSLRELQSKGEKAIQGLEPILFSNRRGPVGFFLPVRTDTLALVQREVARIAALQSLEAARESAHRVGLDRLTASEIAAEIKIVRNSRRRAR